MGTVDCTDSEDFKYKGKKKKNCDWVGAGVHRRKIKNKCKKQYDNKMVYEWCPYTCGRVKLGNCIVIKWLLSYSNKLIVKWFYTIAINTLKLYCCCANFYKIKIYVDYIIRFSALYTLALKNKMSFSSILNTWSRDMVIKDKKNEYVLAHYISKTCINN